LITVTAKKALEPCSSKQLGRVSYLESTTICRGNVT